MIILVAIPHSVPIKNPEVCKKCLIVLLSHLEIAKDLKQRRFCAEHLSKQDNVVRG